MFLQNTFSRQFSNFDLGKLQKLEIGIIIYKYRTHSKLNKILFQRVFQGTWPNLSNCKIPEVRVKRTLPQNRTCFFGDGTTPGTKLRGPKLVPGVLPYCGEYSGDQTRNRKNGPRSFSRNTYKLRGLNKQNGRNIFSRI